MRGTSNLPIRTLPDLGAWSMRNRKVMSLTLVGSAMLLMFGVGCRRRVVSCTSMFGTQSAKVGGFSVGEGTGRESVRPGRDLEGHGRLNVHMWQSGSRGFNARRNQQRSLTAHMRLMGREEVRNSGVKDRFLSPRLTAILAFWGTLTPSRRSSSCEIDEKYSLSPQSLPGRETP